MDALRQVLNGAVEKRILTADQVGPLNAYLAENGVIAAGAARSTAMDAAGEIVDTEAPRFIRGFHDVLITIGVLILLIGAWGIGSVFAALPVIIILAEVLVVRQRLALPAVVLSLAMAIWAIFAALAIMVGLDLEPTGVSWILLLLLPLSPIMGLFYWRYRVPISLAILLLSVFTFVLTVILYLLGRAVGTDDFVESYPLVSSLIFFVSAVGLFSVAMHYDLSDRMRVTLRSDIAFWLHLAAAPALLYAMLCLVFLQKGTGILAIDRLGAYNSAGQVMGIVVVLMAIGLIIDRRAFVTSGLLSLIVTVVSILTTGSLKSGTAVFVAFLVVGSFVLIIGVGWPQLRRLVLGLLPDPLKAKLPPLR